MKRLSEHVPILSLPSPKSNTSLELTWTPDARKYASLLRGTSIDREEDGALSHPWLRGNAVLLPFPN